jgi:hypothetical protein
LINQTGEKREAAVAAAAVDEDYKYLSGEKKKGLPGVNDKETIKAVTFVFECRFIYLPFVWRERKRRRRRNSRRTAT